MIPDNNDSPGNKNIIVVRMAVAKSELMSLTPTLAKIAVSAAKHADNKA